MGIHLARGDIFMYFLMKITPFCYLTLKKNLQHYQVVEDLYDNPIFQKVID